VYQAIIHIVFNMHNYAYANYWVISAMV